MHVYRVPLFVCPALSLICMAKCMVREPARLYNTYRGIAIRTVFGRAHYDNYVHDC